MQENIKSMVRGFMCGYCFAQSGYDIVFADHSETRHVYGDLLEGKAIAVLKCRNCRMLNLLVFSVKEEDFGGSMEESELEPFLAEHPHVLSPGFSEEEGSIAPMWIELMGQYPHGFKLSRDVPVTIRYDLEEAGDCLAVGASNAAAVMCGRAIERLAADFGIKPDKTMMLGAMLGELKDRKLVSEDLFNAMSEVKEWRNIGAHPGKDDQGIELSQAQKIVEFTYLLVEQVFPRRDIHKVKDELKQMRNKK